jgi:hypothetical protein
MWPVTFVLWCAAILQSLAADAGFTDQINMMERTITLMESSKKGVKEYADYYRCPLI